MMRRLLPAGILAVGASAAAQDMSPMSPERMADVMQMRDDAPLGMFKLDQFEQALGRNRADWEAEAWFGGDIDKLWLRSEGVHESARTDARTELFWGHAVDTFWDWQLGARHDSGGGPARNWAAFGVQGLAPYWIELQATAYLSGHGRSAVRLRAEHELLLTQRLILQPQAEFNFYGKSDAQRDIGSGVLDVSVGLRLRYEIRREFAPYLGVVWERRFGHTADLARVAGRDVAYTQLVGGVRIWF